MLPRAEEELRTNVTKLLTSENLIDGVAVETFGGPRRLTAWVRGLIPKQADVTSDVTGPPKSVAYDIEGFPTRAALSFAEKQGLPVADLHIIQTLKGEYLAARQVKARPYCGRNFARHSAASDPRSDVAALDDLDRNRWRAIYSADSLVAGGA